MTKKTILAAFAALVLMCSCSTSQSALNDLRAVSTDVNMNGANYTTRDWKYAAYKYYKADKKIAKYAAKGKYTNDEMQEIGQLQGTCVSGFAKGMGQQVTDKVTNAASLIKGLVDGVKSSLGK